ncbi:MAG: Ig-like domain-containing protein, partial [Maritimibacter harenae]
MRDFEFHAGAAGAPEDVLHVASDAPIDIPGRAIFAAEYQREGHDLVIETAGQPDLRLVDYFRADAPPDLVAGNGAVLRGDLAARLAGPIAPGQYAQAGGPDGADPIGQVETLQGVAFAERVDGTRVQLDIGAKIYENDVLITDGGGKMSVTFADGTIFTLAANSRMVIDDLVYDPDASEGNGGAFSLVKGGFVFIAGEVAKTGGMDVNTPTATMGIRGTTVLVEITTLDGVSTVEVSLNTDPDGGTGMIELRDLSGNLIATIDSTDTKWIVSPVEGETREVVRTADDLADDQALLLDAARAYALAFERVEAGGTFVELSSSSGGSETDGVDTETGTQGNDSDPDDGTPPSGDGSGGGTGGSGGGTTGAPLNTLPEAGDDEATGPEDGTITGNVLANDSDADADPVSVIVNSLPQNGTLDLDNASGAYTYTPDADFSGTDGFTYTISDGNGGTDTASVTLTVTSVQDAPVATDDEITVAEDSGALSFNVLDNDSDADTGDTLSLAAPVTDGFVTIAQDGTVSGTPPADYTGTQVISYTVTDGNGNTDTADLTVTVTSVNDPPVAVEETAETDEDTAVEITPDFAALDVDGDMVTVASVTNGSHGMVTHDGDGTFTYTPSGDFNGTDSFTYTVTDGNGASDSGTITVTVAPVNDAPEATDESVAGDEDNVLTVTPAFEATDVDGDDVSILSVTNGAHGTVEIGPNGELRYTPDANFFGSDSFTYTVTDGAGATDTGSVDVSVAAVNDAPVADDATIEVDAGDVFAGTATASDVEGDDLTFSMGTGPAHGTVTVHGDGSYTYEADAGFHGIDSFEVVVSDGTATDTATVTVAVEPGEVSYTDEDTGQTVTLDIAADAEGGNPAGNVAVDVNNVDATTINLSFALDSSGSVQEDGWADIEDAVYSALNQLSTKFEGSNTTVNVQIVQYGDGVYQDFKYDLADPQLLIDVRALKFEQGGSTDWDEALIASKAFFDSKNVSDTNILYFVTDGVPTGPESAWKEALSDLKDAPYDLDIQAFV